MAAASGYRWLTGVVDHGLRLVAVVALFGVSAVIIAVHHGHHLWLLTLSGGAVLVLALAEGAYSVWSETDQELCTTRDELKGGSSRRSLAGQLDDLAGECVALIEEVNAVEVGPSLSANEHEYAFNDIVESFNFIYYRVDSGLRRGAPQWISYWRENPPGWNEDAPMTHETWTTVLTWSAAQLRHISEQLRKSAS